MEIFDTMYDVQLNSSHNFWLSKWRRKVSHARMSQLCKQSMILAVICSPLKHWPHPVLSSSSRLLLDFFFLLTYLITRTKASENWHVSRTIRSILLKQRANVLDLSNIQVFNMLSVCWGVVERCVQMTSTMTQYVEHSEDFTKIHVEWLNHMAENLRLLRES